MRYPIQTALKKHNNNNPLSFHVPGHKYGHVGNNQTPIHPYDVTELTGLDDFHSPSEVIAESMTRLATIYGTKQSYYLVNGSTVGNLAMIAATCRDGDRVIIPRNAHKSVINGIELANAHPVYIQPEMDEITQTPVAVTVEMIERAIAVYGEIRACVLTYPSYYGQTYDIEKIITYCHKHSIIVLVDEAHGAHLHLGADFPASSLALGADIVVQSAHKTLPAATMGSWLHIGSECVDKQEVERYLRMLQSSSPSYLLLASLEDAMEFLYDWSDSPEMEENFLQGRSEFIERIRTATSLHVYEMADPLKLYITLAGHTGQELLEKLESIGIYSELADAKGVLWILPLQWSTQYKEDCLQRLKDGKFEARETANEASFTPIAYPLVSTAAFSYRELRERQTEIVPLKDAINRVVAEAVIPYPPGIPLVYRGERVTATVYEQLVMLLHANFHVQGLVENRNVRVFRRE